MSRAALTLAAAVLFLGCGHHAREKPREEPHAEAPKDAGAPSVAPPETGKSRPVVLDMGDPKAACVFGYRGTVLELNVPSLRAQFGPKLDVPPVDWIEREGATWGDVHGKSLSVDFFVVLPADVTEEGPAGATPFIEARVRGGAAKSVSFYLNGHAIGASKLVRGETRVVALKANAAQPLPGPNELTMRFSGIAKGSTDPTIELDWVHFGVGEPDLEYAAPAREETWVSKSFAGQAGRAVSLRGPGFVRCEGWIPSGSVLETRARLEGKGAADAEVRVIRDRVPPTVIGTLHLEASGTETERVHSWPIGEIGTLGTLGAVELSVVRASKGARVVFGEPRVLAPAIATPMAHPAPAASHGVVLIVMSEVGARSLSPYGGPLASPNVSTLATSGVAFDSNRATTAIASGAVGSMLTGLSAHDLGVADGDTRLPRGVTTLADAVRQAGIASAFFTANPLTSAAFGFDRGWSHFESHGPTEDGPATRVYEAAATWLEEHRAEKFFLAIHARGGHPPWDVSLERVKGLPPQNYTGGLEARHAAELLGRSFRTPSSFRFEDADRARAWALYGAAMEAEDAGVGRIVAMLKGAGLYESTTFIVTSDVGVNEAARVPFAESESLDEAALATPLIVAWGHDTARGTHVAAASSEEDIATTVLAAFGLPAPVTFRGKDLRALVDDSGAPVSRTLLAVDQDRFALRWGAFVAMGIRDHETKLCDLTLEAACVTDVKETYPLASRLLHTTLVGALVGAKPTFPREPASLDPATLAALKLWGR